MTHYVCEPKAVEITNQQRKVILDILDKYGRTDARTIRRKMQSRHVYPDDVPDDWIYTVLRKLRAHKLIDSKTPGGKPTQWFLADETEWRTTYQEPRQVATAPTHDWTRHTVLSTPDMVPARDGAMDYAKVPSLQNGKRVELGSME